MLVSIQKIATGYFDKKITVTHFCCTFDLRFIWKVSESGSQNDGDGVSDSDQNDQGVTHPPYPGSDPSSPLAVICSFFCSQDI